MLNTVILTATAYAGDEPAAYIVLIVALIAATAQLIRATEKEIEKKNLENQEEAFL